MTYTASTLITKAWYLSGIVSPQLETVPGGKTGLDLLNALLAMKSADMKFINYYSVYDFDLVTGQEMYFIPNLISIQTVTFFIGPVRYPVSPLQRKAYFGTGRVNNISTLPINCHWERVLGGIDLYFYPLPGMNYPAEITGKFSLSAVTLDQDLSLTLSDFFIEYLRYELAAYMCGQYNIQLQGSQAATLQNYRRICSEVSPRDLTMRKATAFNGNNTGFLWFDTFAQGWRPV